MKDVKTLNQFIVERQEEFSYASGELSRLLSDIAVAAKIINREIRQAGLVDILGRAGSENVHGEDVQKLDEFANQQLVSALSSGGECCVMASEEHSDIIPVNTDVAAEAKYVVNFDPLDGSTNIDANAPIGTIFGIYRRVTTQQEPCGKKDVLQHGREQVAAGYVVYGSSTLLVYSTGNGVNGFTLDPSIGEFCLSHPNITLPDHSGTYSINEGNYGAFSQALQQYLTHCKDGNNQSGKPYKARYIGSMVADIHRTLVKGGIFLYPGTKKDPNGKLRLMYEANPMAFLIEQAGGEATDGDQPILDKVPEDLHDRTPVFLGSKDNVEEMLSYETAKTAP
jgi:fructose-1,6-bisphosphatase I